MDKKIRIALLIDQSSVYNFQKQIVDKIALLTECEICLVLNHTNPTPPVSGLLYRLFERMDRLVYGRGKSYVLREQLQLNGVRYLDFHSSKKSEFCTPEAEVIDAIKQDKIDLILKFSDTLFDGDILSEAKYGVWEYAYGKEQVTALFAGLPETLESAPTIHTVLHKLPDSQNNGYIIDTFLSSADPLSAYNNRNAVCWKTHMMMVRNIKYLSENPELFIATKSKDLLFFKKKNYKLPNNREMTKQICKFIYLNIITRIDRLFYKAQWSIYYAENESKYSFQRDMSQFVKIDTPNHLFWADPFVIDHNDKSYIFFEDYVYKTGKGHISIIEYDHKTKEVSEPSIIIDTEYHQSYPFIMAYEDEIYMIPEGSKDLDVKLYRAIDFPHKWEVVRTFFQGKEVVDTTLFFYEGKWWLFANMIDEKGQSLNEELYIYYCDDFRTDEWIPHAQNPVISSVQTSRPAGKIISYQGDLYRPSQNSVGSYGRSTNFNRILELTPKSYREEFVSEITPDYISADGAVAIHTYNSSEKLTVVDVVHKIRRFFNP